MSGWWVCWAELPVVGLFKTPGMCPCTRFRFRYSGHVSSCLRAGGTNQIARGRVVQATGCFSVSPDCRAILRSGMHLTRQAIQH